MRFFAAARKGFETQIARQSTIPSSRVLAENPRGEAKACPERT
jgi:hypothetical protein